MPLIQGPADSFEYRVFVEEKGQQVSTWHDIPLFSDGGLLNMVVEIPKESAAKMEAATVSASACELWPLWPGQIQYFQCCLLNEHEM